MTREQLDAIRVQYATEPPHHIVRALLAEVERLTAEVEAKVTQNVALIGQNGRLQQEVERLRDAHAMAVQVSGELCEKCGWAMRFPGEKCRCELLAEVERLTAERDTAFSRGVAAMREAAAVVAGPNPKWPQPLYDRVHQARADAIRALPDPEDEP